MPLAYNKSIFNQNLRPHEFNCDKSISQNVCERVVAELAVSLDIDDRRVAARLMLQRRTETVFKFILLAKA